MNRVLVALTTALLFCLSSAALAKSSNVSALLPKAEKPATKKRLPTIKTTLKQDKRWHLDPEEVRGKTMIPAYFFIPRASIYPDKSKK